MAYNFLCMRNAMSRKSVFVNNVCTMHRSRSTCLFEKSGLEFEFHHRIFVFVALMLQNRNHTRPRYSIWHERKYSTNIL